MLYFKALRKIRKEKKIRIIRIAAFLGKTRQAVASWEQGRFSPTNAEVRLIAQFLNVPVSDISDLEEIVLTPDTAKKQNLPELDTHGLTPDAAQQLEDMHSTCVELRATNARQRSVIFKSEILLQSLPFYIYVKDRNLKYTYVNENFLNLTGHTHSKNSISGMTSIDFFGFQDYSRILEIEKNAINSKIRISNQQIIIPGTQKKKVGLLTVIPYLNKDEEVEELICTIEDITHSYEAEKRRKDLEAITNKINHMVWIGETSNGDDDTFKYTHISDNISSIYGIDKQAAFNDIRLWIDLIHENDSASVRKWLKIKEFPKKIEYRIKTADGGIKWLSNEVFKEGDNKFYGVVTDITGEKQREAEKEAILQTLDAATDAITIAKAEGRREKYIYANKANKELFELPADEINSNPYIWKKMIHPEDKTSPEPTQKTKDKGIVHSNYRLRMPDDRIKYVEENSFKATIDGTLFSGSIKRDVTQEKKAEEENNTLRDAILKEAEKQNSILRYAIDKVDKVVWVGHFPNKAERAHENFEYFYVSDAVYDMFGLTKEEWCQNKWVETVCSEYKSLIKQHASEGFPFLEYKIIHKVTKEEKWLSAVMYRNDNIGYGFISDITKQKKAEEENNSLRDAILKEAEKQNSILRFAMDKVDKVVWVGHYPENVERAHKNYEYYYVNDFVYDMFGLTKEEFSHGEWEELVCPEYKNLIDEHARNEIPFLEFKITHKVTREVKWINAILYKHGNLQFGFVSDITKQKEKEVQNDMLRFAMDKVDKVVWVGRFPDNVKKLHENFQYFYVNDVVYDMFGLVKEEFSQGKWVDLVCPEYKTLIDNHVREEYPFLEFKIIHKATKEEKWINAVMYKHGNMYFGFISDITKKKNEEFTKQKTTKKQTAPKQQDGKLRPPG